MIQLPPALIERLSGILEEFGESSSIVRVQPVGGGCIHEACQVQTENGRYMLKWNPSPLPEVFISESHGLKLLGSTGAVRVPEVIAAAEGSAFCPAFLLMEWIESPGGSTRQFDQAKLGEELASLHRTEPAQSGKKRYGLERDNYIGEVIQINRWHDEWLEFFRENRLQPQIRLAVEHGRMPGPRRKRLEFLMDHLEKWLGGVTRRPSLLHGDLWGGNVITEKGGQPVLLDPAVYYGDREIDLAFTEMFGGFSSRFYKAYQDNWPLEPGYDIRKDIYNLYHLVNHLNHFGETYGPAIDRTLERFVPNIGGG